MVSANDSEAKWAQRLDRERRARRQAEQLAERGMRELWLANQNLEQKVLERTAELDRSLRSLDHGNRVRRTLIGDLGYELAAPLNELLDALGPIDTLSLTPDCRDRFQRARANAQQLQDLVRSLLAVAKADASDLSSQTEVRAPQDVLDQLVERWQRTAARRSILLVGSFSGTSEPVELDWDRMVAATEAVLEVVVEHADPGMLGLGVHVDAESLLVIIEDSGPKLEAGELAFDQSGLLSWSFTSSRVMGLALAQRVAERDGALLTIEDGERGGVRATLSFSL